MKKIVLILLTLMTIYGCGVASKDTGANAAHEQFLWVFTNKGLNEGRISEWTRAVGQSDKTFQGAPQDALPAKQGLFLATDKGLYFSTDNASTFALLLTANAVSLTSGQDRIWAATDIGCFVSTGNNDALTFELITSANSYKKIVYANDNLYILDNSLQVNTDKGWSKATNVSGNILDFAFLENQLYLLTEDGLTTGNTIIETPFIAEKIFTFDKQLWLSGNKILAKSTDNGITWVSFDSGVNYNGNTARDILVSGLNIYVTTENGVWYSLNGGESWKVLRKQNGILSNNTVKTLLR